MQQNILKSLFLVIFILHNKGKRNSYLHIIKLCQGEVCVKEKKNNRLDFLASGEIGKQKVAYFTEKQQEKEEISRRNLSAFRGDFSLWKRSSGNIKL